MAVLRVMRLLLIALMLLVATDARAVELRISGAELAALLERSFTGTVIRLHQDENVSGAMRAGSFLRLPPTLGGTEVRFSIPPREQVLAPGVRARFAVNDVRSESGVVAGLKPITVRATQAAFNIAIQFEDADAEIVSLRAEGRAARVSRWLVPDVEVNDISLRVALLPRTGPRGEIVFLPPEVIFIGNVQAGGVGSLRILGREIDLLHQVTDYRDEIKRGVEREVKRSLQQQLPYVARALTAEVRRRGKEAQIDVTAIRFEGTTLVINGRSRLISD